MSTNQLVKREVRLLMRKHRELTTYQLRIAVQEKLGVKLRVDYLVCNLMGMKDIGIDCESHTVMNLREKK